MTAHLRFMKVQGCLGFYMKKNKIKDLLKIFLTMLKIGAFTFGGGYAMLSLLENEFVSKHGYIDRDEFIDLIAISESTPGPIAINTATYIGYKSAGYLGSLVATLGMCIPSFVIIYAISLFFDSFLANTYVACAFRGIQVCVIYLILTAGIKMLRGIKKTPYNTAVISLVFVGMLAVSLFAVKLSVIVTILASGFLGVAIYLARTLVTREADK